MTNCICKIAINNCNVTNCICKVTINNCEMTNCICKITISNCEIDFALIYMTEGRSETAGKKKQQKNNLLQVKEIIFK